MCARRACPHSNDRLRDFRRCLRRATDTAETMNDTPQKTDYSGTLYLPTTEFPMRAGLPEKEPKLVERWQEMGLYRRLREDAGGRPLYVLHDGPPYANGNIHIGHALNKVLKDMITRSFQMRGYDSNYVPGWDCHGLPIEWKIEEQYRAKGLDKDQVPVNEFRQECRDFASHWIEVQTQEFKRLGVEGDFDNPYTTMAFHAEARIAGELLKFAMSGQLYRGSKPVMWSVVERTALAEAEVEYQDYESDTVWVKFPVVPSTVGGVGLVGDLKPSMNVPDWHGDLARASVVIWTTTPWTIPGNRAISYSPRIKYGLYRVTDAENDFGPQPGETLVLAQSLAEECFARAKLGFDLVCDVLPEMLGRLVCAHPLRGFGGDYSFAVPLIAGEHVTDDAGTGFVHTAPGHGREDFDAWIDAGPELRARGIDTTIPFTVDDAGYFTTDAPGFGPDRPGGAARVIDDNGKKGDANKAVIDALIEKKHAVCERTPEAFLSAFLALQEAGHLPQHAAMVRPHGQGAGRVRIEQPLIRPFGPPSPTRGEGRARRRGGRPLSPCGRGWIGAQRRDG